VGLDAGKDGRFDRNAAMDDIRKHLLGRAATGKRYGIVIDGAEWIDNDGLGVLEILNDIRRDGSFLATFILSGRESTARRILALPGLRDRFALSARVEPLDEQGSNTYVAGRAAAAGAAEALFGEDALSRIASYAKGVPRRINRVCDLALLTAFGLEKKTVDGEVMEAVIEELSQSPI
jgi:general secretion pathway protein A